MATALITGPTAGIGRAFADKLAADGYDLVLVARDKERLNEIAAEISGRAGVDCEVLAADLTNPAQLAEVEERLGDEARPVEVLVNNAGFGAKKPFWANTIEQEEKQFDLLVRAVLRLTHAAVLPMISRGSGAVINVSSVAGFVQRGSYSAHKAWVTNFSEGLAVELRSKGVAVMALCPGFVHTEFHERMGMDKTIIPSFMWLNADELVDAAWADLMKGKAVSVPSLRYKVITAFARYTPRTVIARLSTVGLDGRRRT
ncbi:SDR family NAD(P)-dependent oxidoreductase [Kribbella deserti]|uniref:SDR family NAD(P)-dependent oxidoreductase n=1 Tax=Kribbella deserti TaxID=1926257 RepID=A0ABV6QRG6_9ACTN